MEGEDYVDQLRRSRARAEAEGRVADADCVLALACAAACRDDWEEAAELVGAPAGTLLDDTAGFFHLSLVRDQMVRPGWTRGVRRRDCPRRTERSPRSSPRTGSEAEEAADQQAHCGGGAHREHRSADLVPRDDAVQDPDQNPATRHGTISMARRKVDHSRLPVTPSPTRLRPAPTRK